MQKKRTETNFPFKLQKMLISFEKLWREHLCAISKGIL